MMAVYNAMFSDPHIKTYVYSYLVSLGFCWDIKVSVMNKASTFFDDSSHLKQTIRFEMTFSKRSSCDCYAIRACDIMYQHVLTGGGGGGGDGVGVGGVGVGVGVGGVGVGGGGWKTFHHHTQGIQAHINVLDIQHGNRCGKHYSYLRMSVIASQIIGVSIVGSCSCLFMRRPKKTSKSCVTGLCEGNPPVTGGFPHKGTVTRKIFPFDDIIMQSVCIAWFACVVQIRKGTIKLIGV